LACHKRWKEAKRAAWAMVEAAKYQEAMTLATAANALDLALRKMWEIRAGRPDMDWRTILNHTRRVLQQCFDNKQVETLSVEQCQRIREIVERHLGPAAKNVDDLRGAVRLMEDAGFDPYAAISADPVDEGGG